MHTFTYQKTLHHKLFCLFLKSSETFSVFLTVIVPEEVSAFRTQFFDNAFKTSEI